MMFRQKSTDYYLRAKAFELAYERAREMKWYSVDSIVEEADKIYKYLVKGFDKADLDDLDNPTDVVLQTITRAERVGEAFKRAERACS